MSGIGAEILQCQNCGKLFELDDCPPIDGDGFSCPVCGLSATCAERNFDHVRRCAAAVIGIDSGYEDEPDTLYILKHGAPLVPERVCKAIGPLTQEQAGELKGGTKVLIVWARGGGPWEYEILRSGNRVYASNMAYPLWNVGARPGQHQVWILK